MLKEFEKFAGVKILRYFLLHPEIEVHVKELARKLAIGPATSKYYLDIFSEENLFIVKKVGNVKVFSLDNQNVYVKEIKRTFSLFFFKENGLDQLSEDNISLAVYGSYASGEYDEKSDLDLIAVRYGKDKINKDKILEFENKIRKQIQLTEISYHDWEKMKKDKKQFVYEVLSNHILIAGEEL
ncbi:nucleotidyltransferase domain-containing protein [Candidatus Pacearchaeota archaeon]|nr:nucleotidyltransferase domain-containing protein [Candidatus Pacearchaeota archaeon]